jgi:peptidyl-prolyl cis-trans isomerase D
MIQWMHTLSKSWVATLLMGGLTLSFVVWGIADIFTSNLTGSSVATVGGTDIGQAEFQRTYRNFLRNQGQQMGTEITPDMAQKMGLGQVALQQMVSRTALNNEAQKLGLTVSDAAVAQSVRSMAPFRGTLGQFDRRVFVQAIQAAGYTEDQFLEEIRQDMTREQLTAAVEGNFIVPPTYAQALFQYINEKRAAEFVVLSPEQAGDVPAPSEAVLSAYVKLHADRFSTPEYRDADYAAITPADVTGAITVTEAQLQQAYDAQKSTYVVAEKRDVQQIEFKTQGEAADASAKVKAGMTFEELATRRGQTLAQISLGTLAQDELPDAERAKAIFALPLNQVSEPIKTGFGGFALARVTKITPGSSKTLADVKDELSKTLLTQLAAAKLVDAVNAYTDARSGGDEMKDAAKKAGMKVSHLTGVDMTGMAKDGAHADVPADPEFLPAVFKGEVGDDTDPFATKLGGYYTIHVNGVTPPKLKPLDQVRAQALADWTAEQRSKLLATRAQALAIQAAKDKSLDGIARTLKVPVQHSPALTRQTNDIMFSAAMVTKLFNTPAGGVDFGPQGSSGNYVIARITGIAHPTLNPRDQGFQGGVMRFSQSVAGDFSIALSNAARTRQGVKVNQKLVQSVTGSGL